MSEQLWSDERIEQEMLNRFALKGTYLIAVRHLAQAMRAEYEAHITKMMEANNALRTGLTNAMDSILADAKRINELEAKLATSEELAEQHLVEIDSLERQLRAREGVTSGNVDTLLESMGFTDAILNWLESQGGG